MPERTFEDVTTDLELQPKLARVMTSSFEIRLALFDARVAPVICTSGDWKKRAQKMEENPHLSRVVVRKRYSRVFQPPAVYTRLSLTAGRDFPTLSENQAQAASRTRAFV